MKKIFALLILTFMLLPMFIACGNGDGTETPGTSLTLTDQAGDASGAGEDVTTASANPVAFPQMDFGGRTVYIVNRAKDMYKDEAGVESLNGEVINDAIFNRNSFISSYLNVKIAYQPMAWVQGDGEVMEPVRKQVLSGTHEYDMFISSTYRAVEAIGDSLFLELKQLPYVDFSMPYWSDGFNDAASIGGKYFVANGAICLSMYRSAFATFFNKSIFDNYKLPYLYDVVEAGKWTLEYQYDLASQVYEDLNGNNTADAADRFGFASCPQGCVVDPYWSSCQLPILTKDANDLMVISFNEERLTNAITRINHLFWENTGSYCVPWDGAGQYLDSMVTFFAEDHAATETMRLRAVEVGDMRNMSSLYGIVPMPKYDEEQAEYGSLIHDGVSCVGIPNTLKESDFELMGAFMELMAAESARSLVPAYYEVALKTKYVSDEQSSKMLDLIFDTIYIDPGIMYVNATSNFHQKMRTLVGSNSNNIASTLKATEKVMQKSVDRVNSWADLVP